MSIITRNKLKEALKGSGECKTIKAGKRMQYLWRDSSHKGSDPLGDTIELNRHADNNIILDHFCAEFDGVFIKNVDSNTSKKSIFQEQSDILSECSDVIRVLTDACSDGKITTKEIDTLKVEVDEFVRRFYSFTKAVESGRHS